MESKNLERLTREAPAAKLNRRRVIQGAAGLGLSALAVLLLFKLHRSIIETLSICAALSLALYTAGVA